MLRVFLLITRVAKPASKVRIFAIGSLYDYLISQCRGKNQEGSESGCAWKEAGADSGQLISTLRSFRVGDHHKKYYSPFAFVK